MTDFIVKLREYTNMWPWILDTDYDSLDDALSACGTAKKTLLVTTSHTLTGATSVPTTVCLSFLRGGVLVTSGQSLTINGPMETNGNFQIFDGTDTITFGQGSVGRINAAWWGLVGDGNIQACTGTDNGAAFSAAIRAVKATNSAIPTGDAADKERRFVPMYLPAGVYLTETSLFLGSNRAGGDGYADKVDFFYGEPGSTIIGNHEGPVVDMSGGHTCRLKDLTIVGSNNRTPSCGILLARSGASGGTDYSAGGHEFHSMDILGDFEYSAVYNYASEINQWYGCYLTNRRGYAAYIMTYNNSCFGVTSPNTTLPTGDGRSSFGPKFYGCTFNYFAEPQAGSGAVMIFETIARGPQLYGSYINQGPSDGVPGIKFRYASGTTTKCHEPVIDGVTFHSGNSCGIQIECQLENMRVRGCAWGSPSKAAIVLDDSSHGDGVIVQDCRIEAPSIDATTYMTGNARFLFGNEVWLEYHTDAALNPPFFTCNYHFYGNLYLRSTDSLTYDEDRFYGNIHYLDTGQVMNYYGVEDADINRYNIAAGTAAYTATGYEKLIIVNTDAAQACTITLPDVTEIMAGTELMIYFNTDGGADVTVDCGSVSGQDYFDSHVRFLHGSVVWDPGNLIDGAGETQSLTVTGAAFGDSVNVAAAEDMQDMILTGYVQAADTVEIRIQNESGGAVNLASRTWHVHVLKWEGEGNTSATVTGDGSDGYEYLHLKAGKLNRWLVVKNTGWTLA